MVWSIEPKSTELQRISIKCYVLRWASEEVTEEPFDPVWLDATEVYFHKAACIDDYPSDLWDLLHVCGRA